MNGLVVTLPQAPPPDKLEEWADAFEKWDGKRPVFLGGGVQLSTVGGMSFRPRLSGGPLDGLAFAITVPTLDALPQFLVCEEGSYVRWLNDAGQWMQTSEGDPYYCWKEEP